MNLITPILIFIASIGLFVGYTLPSYHKINNLKSGEQSYDTAIDNSIKYRQTKESLASQYSQIGQSDIDRLKKMLPDTLDNVRLVIDLEKIANESSLVFKNVQYNAELNKKEKNQESGVQSPHGSVLPSANSVDVATPADAMPYGVALITFTVQGPYENFLTFLAKAESSLRIIDVTSVAFASNDTVDVKKAIDEYDYNITIRTYWLKN